MASKLNGLVSAAKGAIAVILPRAKSSTGTALAPTYNPASPQTLLTLPAYRDHLTDIFDTRAANDSRALLQLLFVQDPDMSAAVNAFLTMADTEMMCLVKDQQGQLDNEGQNLLNSAVLSLTTRNDYSKGFAVSQSLTAMNEAFRYMLLLRGSIGGELILSKEFLPASIRQVDTKTIEFYEKTNGLPSPIQRTTTGELLNLDIPTFFMTWFRRDPTSFYSHSPFVSSINTIAARQQVINDLYRIMRLTGFPRLEVTVMEEVLIKNAPANVTMDPAKKAVYLNQKMAEINGLIQGIRPDQAFIHFDSIEPKIMNEKSSASTLDIGPVIAALNAQNQAGLRSMATILGRGESGVNTASVEARVFSMNAQALNEPIADIWSQILTMAIRFQGSQSRVEVTFRPVELRPETELEPMLTIRAQRLRQDLSDGIISDAEYTLQMYNRLPLPGAPLLSGTGFAAGGGPDVSKVSPNSDPLGRSLAPKGGQAGVKDNRNKPVASK